MQIPAKARQSFSGMLQTGLLQDTAAAQLTSMVTASSGILEPSPPEDLT